MNNLGKVGSKLVFYIVALILVAWTASLTYGFIKSALPTMAWYVPVFGLVVFDVGMIAWLTVFLNYAEGDWQRVTAIALTIFDTLGVGLMVIAEILLGGQTWTEAPEMLGTLALWGIGIWTVVNVFGVIIFHLMSPEARVSMALQSSRDAIFNTALDQLNQRRQEEGEVLARQLSGKMMNDLVDQLKIDRNRDGIPDVYQSEDKVRTVPNRPAPRFERPDDVPDRSSLPLPDFPPPEMSTIHVHGQDPFADYDDLEDLEDFEIDDPEAFASIRSNHHMNFGGPYGPGQCVICGKQLTGRQELYCSNAHRQMALRRRKKDG